MSPSSFGLPLFLILPFIAAVGSPCFAQDRPQIRSQSIAINPVFAPLGTIHLEYEYAPSKHPVTVGAATWLEYRDIQDNWFHLRVLYYPGNKVFEGFAAGVTAGYHRWDSDEVNTVSRESAPVAGAAAQYNWLLTNDKRLVAGLGFSAEVPLKQRGERSPISKVNSNLRLVVGWRF
jgi:hypothetical protein